MLFASLSLQGPLAFVFANSAAGCQLRCCCQTQYFVTAIEILEYGGRREGSLGSAEDNDINDKLDDISGSAEFLKEIGQLQYPSSLEKMKFGGPRWRIYTSTGDLASLKLLLVLSYREGSL